MSLGIDVDHVHSVLLADGWHDVWNDSFFLDSYEFMWDEECVHGGGQSDICAVGFSFTESCVGFPDKPIYGPLTAILAVRTQQ